MLSNFEIAELLHNFLFKTFNPYKPCWQAFLWSSPSSTLLMTSCVCKGILNLFIGATKCISVLYFNVSEIGNWNIRMCPTIPIAYTLKDSMQEYTIIVVWRDHRCYANDGLGRLMHAMDACMATFEFRPGAFRFFIARLNARDFASFTTNLPLPY